MGIIQSIYNALNQIFPPKSKFDPQRDVPDLTGKVAIVTGGNTGIGKETIKVLLQKNAKVYMASRLQRKAVEAIADLKRETGKDAFFLQLDLANLNAVTQAAEDFKSKEPELHLLFNSGGVMVPPIDELTSDSYDLQFGTNVLGHAHFTLCLLPSLISGARSSPDGKARIVFTSSLATYANTFPLIKWNTLKGDSPERRKLRPSGLYNQSKYGVVAFSNELARRYADQGIVSNAVNPGSIQTDLQRNFPPIARFFTHTFISKPAPYGAWTQLYAATSPKVAHVNGGWFIPWARLREHGPKTRDPEIEAQLWDWIEGQRRGHY